MLLESLWIFEILLETFDFFGNLLNSFRIFWILRLQLSSLVFLFEFLSNLGTLELEPFESSLNLSSLIPYFIFLGLQWLFLVKNFFIWYQIRWRVHPVVKLEPPWKFCSLQQEAHDFKDDLLHARSLLCLIMFVLNNGPCVAWYY